MSTQLSGPVTTAAQGIYDSSSNQNHVLGETIFTNDGRAFRYCLAGGTTLVSGKLQQASAEDTTNYQNLTPAAAAIGDISITISTSTTVTANALVGGTVSITTSTGLGKIYRIKANTATSAAAGLVITLDDAIQVALTTSSRIDVIPNPYSGVIVNPTTASSTPVGVAVAPITNAQYGWLQVAGHAVCLADGTVTVGTTLVASNGTAGAVEAFAGVQAVVGLAITGIATTEYGTIKLMLL